MYCCLLVMHKTSPVYDCYFLSLLSAKVYTVVYVYLIRKICCTCENSEKIHVLFILLPVLFIIQLYRNECGARYIGNRQRPGF